jgi:hypothetical protein
MVFGHEEYPISMYDNSYQTMPRVYVANNQTFGTAKTRHGGGGRRVGGNVTWSSQCYHQK